jgi:hypothetical protein
MHRQKKRTNNYPKYTLEQWFPPAINQQPSEETKVAKNYQTKLTTLIKNKNALLSHFSAMKHTSLQNFLDILHYVLHIGQRLQPLLKTKN